MDHGTPPEDGTETSETTARRAARQRVLAALAPPVQHEVNNQLTVLFANLESLRRVVPAEGPPQRQLERVTLASRRLQDAVGAFTVMARRPLPDLAAVEPAKALAALEPLLRLVLGSRNALALETGPEELPPVRLDRSLLDLGLLELAREAAARLERGARLGFALRAAGAGEGGGVELAVTGLPPAPDARTLRALAEGVAGRLETTEDSGGTTLRAILPPDQTPA
jgi:hypothetical protein